MTALTGKRVFAFDWDGTVLDSMPTKMRTFSTVLADVFSPLLAAPPADLATQLRDGYASLSGRPRREIVETLARAHGLDADAVDYDAFSRRLSEVNQRALASAEVFADAVVFLRALLDRGHAVYVSSSVPQAELEALVRLRLPVDVVERLKGVFGSDGAFTKGPAHVARMLRESGAEPGELQFFGDDTADAQLCREAEVDCVLVDRRARLDPTETGAPRVPDFGVLLRELPEVDAP